MRRATTRRVHLLQDVSVTRLPGSVCACAGRHSLHTLSQRPRVIASSNIESAISQKRDITQQNIRRKLEAEQQWKGFAEEIRAGKRKAFLDHLEERELVNQVVGSVPSARCFVNGVLDALHLANCDDNQRLTWFENLGEENSSIKSSRIRERVYTPVWTRQHRLYMLDICFRLWFWRGPSIGVIPFTL